MILLSATFSFLKQGHPLCQYLSDSRPLHIKNYVLSTLSSLVEILLGSNSPVVFGAGKGGKPLYTIEFNGIINVLSMLRTGLLLTPLVFQYGIPQPHFAVELIDMLEIGWGPNAS